MKTKHRTYSDYYHAYIRALRHNRLALAAKLHCLAHDVAKQEQLQHFYDEMVLAACG